MDQLNQETLIAIIMLLAGVLSGVAVAHTSIRKLLRIHDRQIGENTTAITDLRSYVDGVDKRTDQLQNLQAETLNLVSANTVANSQLTEQNTLLIKTLLEKNVNA